LSPVIKTAHVRVLIKLLVKSQNKAPVLNSLWDWGMTDHEPFDVVMLRVWTDYQRYVNVLFPCSMPERMEWHDYMEVYQKIVLHADA